LTFQAKTRTIRYTDKHYNIWITYIARGFVMKIEVFLKNTLNIDKEAHAAAEAVSHLVQRGHDDDTDAGGALIEEYAQDLTTMKEQAAEVAKMVAALPNPDVKQVFEYRYLHKLSWEDVAEATNFSVVQAHRLHRKGIEWLERYY